MIILKRLARKHPFTAGADALRRGRGRGRTPDRGGRSAPAVGSSLPRVPTLHRNRARGRLPADFDPCFQQRLAQPQRHWVAQASQRQQMQHILTHGQIQPGARGQVSQELQVRVAMLKQPRPKSPRRHGVHSQADVRRHVGGQLGNGDIDMRCDRLALTQPMKQIIAAHAQLTLPGRPINPGHGRDFTRKERNRLPVGLDHKTDAWRQLRRGIQRPGRIAKNQLTQGRQRQALLHPHLVQSTVGRRSQRRAVRSNDDTWKQRHAHYAAPRRPPDGMRSVRPSPRCSGSAMSFKAASKRHKAASPR